MKRILLIIIVWGYSHIDLKAQQVNNRIGYIDMNYILKHIPEYEESTQRLNKEVDNWKQEIDMKQEQINILKENLENERPLLTPELIEERQEEIDYQIEKLKEYQEKRFGINGDMTQKRTQITKPLEDQVFNTIQEIGLEREYDFIFDSSADALMLYSAERHDISDQVLAGINRNTNRLSREKAIEEKKLKRPEGEETYKSVQQARLEQEKRDQREAERKKLEKERQDRLDQLRKERDDIRKAKIEEQEAKRAAIEQRRHVKQDSINSVRQKLIDDKNRKRDSLLLERKKARENINKS